MKHNIKLIEKEIIKILKNGEDIKEFTDKFNTILKKLDNEHSELESNKIKLLNYLLKYPKKKILFEIEIEKDNHKRKYIVGLNESGVGLITDNTYQHNLKSITDYYYKYNFSELCENKNFIDLFLKSIKKKYRKIVGICLNNFKRNYTKKINTKNIEIFFDDYSISYKFINNDDTINNIKILSLKDNLHFDLDELKDYAKLLKNKNEIIKVLKKEIKGYAKLEKELNNKLEEVNKELKPFQALQQI